MKNDSNYKSTEKKEKISFARQLLRWFRTVMVLSAHIYSLTLFHSLTLSLSFSLFLFIHYIFLSLSTARLFSFRTRLMLVHSRWDWVNTSTRSDSSGSMWSNNAVAENIHSRSRLPTIDVTRKTVCRESRYIILLYKREKP